MAVLYVSDFLERIVSPVPDMPLASGGPPNYGALYNAYPAPARTETYQYALLDGDDLLSPWSDPTTVTHEEGGGVHFDYADFVPTGANIKAILWRIDDRIAVVCEGGAGPEQFTPKLPFWSALRPGINTDLRKTGHRPPKAGTSQVLTKIPPRPVFSHFGIPNVDIEIFYRFVLETGLSEPSPSVLSPPNEHMTSKGVTYRRMIAPGVKIPPGATAYKVYGRIGEAIWTMGTFPIDCMQPMLTEWTATNPVPPWRSRLHPFQQALDARRSGDVVIVDVPVIETSVPIIDQFGPVRTRIVGLHGMPWTINYTGDGEVALLVQSHYTTYEGMTLKGGCRATSNWAGGQAFGNQYRDCWFDEGIRTLNTSSRWLGDHTESETLFDNCTFRGRVPIRLEGQQTANIRFRRTHAVSSGGRDRGTCVLWIETPNQIVFEGGLYADAGHVFAHLGFMSNVKIDDLWDDQGHEAIFDQFSYYPAKVRLRGGKINFFGSEYPWLCRGSFSQVSLEDVDGQQNHPGPGAFRLRTSKQPVFRDCPKLKEWTEAAPVGPVGPVLPFVS